MGKLLIPGGGGGADTSMVTATSGDILSGKVIVDKDGNPAQGTMADQSVIDMSIGGFSSEYPNVAIHKGRAIAIQSTTSSNEKLISIVPPTGYFNNSARVGTPASELGSATQTQVLSGVGFTSENGVNLTGTMPNNGAVAPAALGAGGSYTIPEGYHNGNGKVTAKPLVELTADAVLDPQFLLEGYSGYDDGALKWGTMKRVGNNPSASLTTTDPRRVIVNDWGTNECWVINNSDGQYRALINIPVTGYYDGNDVIAVPASRMAACGGLTADKMPVGKSAFGISGTLAVNSAISFSAATLSSSSIRISWTNPSKGPWTGVFIQMSTSGYPGTSGGSRVYTGRGNSTTAGGSNYVDITGLSSGTTYYFTCTSYVDNVGWGSSYNVNAITLNVDTVLWDGSNMQNGALWYSNNGTLQKEGTVGWLVGKYIVIKVKSSLSQVRAKFQTYNTRGSIISKYVYLNGISNGWMDWTPNTEYVYPCTNFPSTDLIKGFRMTMEDMNNGLNFPNTVAYLAVRG